MYKESVDFYCENYKMLLKEIKEDMSKWKTIQYSWIGRCDIVDISTTQSGIQIQHSLYQDSKNIIFFFFNTK